MREHIRADEPFVREDVPVAEALDRFRAEGQDYKVELIEDLVRDASVETVSLYTNGPFTDLCRGPHAPSTARIGAVKLQSLAGAYWRGDASRQMLTRVYGTAFFKQSGSTSTSTASSRRAAHDHRRPRAPARALRLLRGRAGRGLLDAARRHRLQRARAPQPRDVRDPRLPRGQDAPALRR